MKAPCYKCADRMAGCHASCEKYEAFAKERSEANAKRYRESVMDGVTVGQKSRQRSKARAKQTNRMHWG